VDGICDDNDLIDVVQTDGLIDTTSDGKKLSFSSRDINGMTDCLDDWTVMDMDMCYQSSDLVLDTCI